MVSQRISSDDLIILNGLRLRVDALATYFGVEEKNKTSKQKGGSAVAVQKTRKVSTGKPDAANEVDEDDSNNFLVGIDLGTSRSAIVTQDGEKALELSIVGWPKDVISIKVLGKSILFGEEALKSRDSLEIGLPCVDGVVNDLAGRGIEAAEALIRHLLDLTNVPSNKRVCGVIGVPATASDHSKELLLAVGKKIMDHVMLISEPFAVAYNTSNLSAAIVVDVGAGTTDMCAMKGRSPEANDQITVKRGGVSVDEVLLESIQSKYRESSITIHMVKRFKEQYATVDWPEKKIIVDLRVRGENQPHDITEEMIMACTSLVPFIIDGCKQLLRGFDPDFTEAALSNIILAGGMSQIKGLDAALHEGLKKFGTPNVTVIKDSAYGVAKGGLKLGSDIPVKFWNQIGDLGIDGS